MTPKPQEIVSGRDLAGRLLEVELGVVLSRLIASMEKDPAQLRTVVYEFARVKLETGVWRQPTNDLAARRLALALDSAIKCVEIVYSRQDALRAPQFLDRSIESSEIGRSDVMTQPRGPQPINQLSTETVGADQLPVYLARAKRVSSIFKPMLQWPGAGPLLRGAMVAIFAVATCGVFSQFGTLGRQAMPSLPSQPETEQMVRPAAARTHDAPSAHFRHRRVVSAESTALSPGDPSRDSGDYDPPRVGPDEQPVKPPRPGCSTQTYKVPSEAGGETSVNVVRCIGQ
jgi:hypothetical protein